MPVCPWCEADVADVRFPCRSCGKRPKDHVAVARTSSGKFDARVEPDLPLTPQPLRASPSRAGLRSVSAEPRREASPPAPPSLDLELSGGGAYPDLELGGGPMLGLTTGALGNETPPSAPALDVPDLAFAPRSVPAPVPSRPAARPSNPSAPGSAAEVPSFAPPPMKASSRRPASPGPAAASFDEMDLSNDFGTIDLAGDDAREPENAAVVPSVVPAAVTPTGTTMLLSEDGGKAAARRLGAYGEAPDAWWKAPAYAYRVRVRQLDLRRALASRRAELATAQGAADDVLIGLAERGRTVLSQKDSYSKLLGAVISAEHALRERDSALAAETDAHRLKTAGLDARIAQQEAELSSARAAEQTFDDAFARADAVRLRADAKVKRIDIELRSAVARANAAGGPGGATASAEVTAAVAARTADREARLAEVDQAMPAVIEATQKLAAARRKTATIEQALLVVKNERAAIEAAFNRRGAKHSVEVARAQKDVRAALAVLGRAAAADTATFGAEWSAARRDLVALDQTIAARDDDVMLHVMALDAYDRAKAQSGLTLALAVLGLLLVVAIVPLVLRTSAPPPPPSVVNLPE